LRDLPAPESAFTAYERPRRTRVEMTGGDAAARNNAKAGQAGDKPASPHRSRCPPRPPPPHRPGRDRQELTAVSGDGHEVLGLLRLRLGSRAAWLSAVSWFLGGHVRV
ncbi:hypothetical protein ABT317_41650, partial [Streptomyces carpinensis]